MTGSEFPDTTVMLFAFIVISLNYRLHITTSLLFDKCQPTIW